MAEWKPFELACDVTGETLTLSDGGTVSWSVHPDRSVLLELSWRNVDDVRETTTDASHVERIRAQAIGFAGTVMRAHLTATMVACVELEAAL